MSLPPAPCSRRTGGLGLQALARTDQRQRLETVDPTTGEVTAATYIRQIDGLQRQGQTIKAIVAAMNAAYPLPDKEVFGVSYHPAHVSRLMRALGQSVQLPVTQATQRDEAAIQTWWDERWPELKKKAEAEGRTIVWVDEAGFYVLPARIRTYAPRGHTPVLRGPFTRDHLSAIRALTTSGRVVMHVQEAPFRGPGVVRFLKHLLRQIPGKVLVIWDGAPIHRSTVVKAFLAASGAARLWLEQLPAYAPDLNPVKGIWRYLKQVRLRNVCCRTLSDLRYELRLATANLRHEAQVLASLPKLCGYQL